MIYYITLEEVLNIVLRLVGSFLGIRKEIQMVMKI